MSTTTKATKQPWTADELCRLPEGWRYEIDEGELVIMPLSTLQHSRVLTRTAYLLSCFEKEHRLGEVLMGGTGVFFQRVPVQTLRNIEVCFYSSERVKRIADRDGFPDVPPDLVVEALGLLEPDVGRKVDQCLKAGVRSVWVVDPRKRTLTQHRPGEERVVIAELDATVQDTVLPGFECSLRDLLGAR